MLPSVKGRFDELIRSLLWDGRLPSSPTSPGLEREFDILRAKAFLRTTDGRTWILQGVRDVYEVNELGPEEGRTMGPKLVLIGRGLSGSVRQRIMASL